MTFTVLALLGVLAATDDGSPAWLLLAGPAAGVLVWTMLYRYYRNTDKSHSYERETAISSQPIRGSDVKVSEVRGTRSRSISGNNVQDHRRRVGRLTE